MRNMRQKEMVLFMPKFDIPDLNPPKRGESLAKDLKDLDYSQQATEDEGAKSPTGFSLDEERPAMSQTTVNKVKAGLGPIPTLGKAPKVVTEVESKKESEIDFEALDESTMSVLLDGFEAKQLGGSNILNVAPKNASLVLRWVNFKGYNGSREETSLGQGFTYAQVEDIKDFQQLSEERIVVRNNGKAICFEDVVLMKISKLKLMMHYKALQDVGEKRLRTAMDIAKRNAESNLKSEHGAEYRKALAHLASEQGGQTKAKIEFYQGEV